MADRLDKESWIDAGLRALAAGGADSVRVEPIAAALCVTKGSFYWHFRNRGEFLAAILEAWEVRATEDVIRAVEAEKDDPAVRLRRLFTIALGTDGRLDIAVRAWAAHDAAAQETLARVDKRRLSYLVAMFRSLGFDQNGASARSQLAYTALIGQYLMGATQGSRELLGQRVDMFLPLLLRRD
jgi:AcrR family transcriptional regulator